MLYYRCFHFIMPPMQKKQAMVVGGLAFLVVIGVAIFLFRGRPQPLTVVTQDTRVRGDLVVDKEVTLTRGAELTVDGDLALRGSVRCDKGPLRLHVIGDAVINGSVECTGATAQENDGIALVVEGTVTFTDTARIVSSGSVQIVRNTSDLAQTPEEMEALFDDTARATGDGVRVGPFVNDETVGAAADAVPITVSPRTHASTNDGFAVVARAHAASSPTTVVGGTWVIGQGGAAPANIFVPTPARGIQHILLNFRFGTGDTVILRNFHLQGPNGRSGESDRQIRCDAVGGRGEDAFRLRVSGGTIVAENATLVLGNGGRGGIAETKDDCAKGTALGGVGGAAGNLKMIGSLGIDVGSLTIVPGVGGQGGDAIARGRLGTAACPGNDGGNATAVGGAGGANAARLSFAGAVSGKTNVTVQQVIGGNGGLATALPGNGGAGQSCGCPGGNGGNATATGGNGGNATVALPQGVGIAIGGNGGDSDATGGTGGAGGSCGPDAAGGAGGSGGFATGAGGGAGHGITKDGEKAQARTEVGGNGGNGGSGCGPGAGGVGGSGKPKGTDGVPGGRTCVAAQPVTTTPAPRPELVKPIPIPSPRPTPPASEPVTPKPEIAKQRIEVVPYNGKYLPVSQLIIESEQGCDGGQPHWLAAAEGVTATDGTFVPDPGPECGYGRKDRVPSRVIEF